MEAPDPPPILEELIPGADRLYVVFGGIAGQIGMPPFEFYRAASVLNDSKIFLRDSAQAWYQRGLGGIGADPWGVGAFLARKIEESGAREVRFVGNSMGGFAALLFCGMLRRGKVIAFAPQTFVTAAKRAAFGDERWQPQIEALGTPRIGDLRTWLDAEHPAIEAEIYVSQADALDLAHAEELKELPGVRIHVMAEGGHQLVRTLRDRGELAEILRR